MDSIPAYDSYENRLPIVAGDAIFTNDQLTLEWKKGRKQTVVLNALDNWKQRATCQFDVNLIGKILRPKKIA